MDKDGAWLVRGFFPGMDVSTRRDYLEGMNFVYLSPHFPPNYYPFCVRLKNLGVTVLGLADAPHDLLRPELRVVLTEYYRVGDMHDYGQLVRACGHFTHLYGKIDRIDSHNEYWLETEARLRTDFNVPGIQAGEIAGVKSKAMMKRKFVRAGVPVARGEVVRSLEEARRLVGETGYPVVAKPDVGVGAARTYKIPNDEELTHFFLTKPPGDYLLEEFIAGRLFSFDGLADRDGDPVFFTAHAFSQGIMETVNADDHMYYYSLREVPPDLEEAGRRVLAEFAVRERFFHLEFFRRDRDGQIVALEVNMRPPGGLTTDMFNYANDIDIYREWANVVVHNRFDADWSRPYHCGYIGRKDRKKYAHSHEEVLRAFGHMIPHHERISGVFRAAIGDYGYLVRSPDLGEIREAAGFILALK